MEKTIFCGDFQEGKSDKWLLAVGKIGFGQDRSTSIIQMQNKTDECPQTYIRHKMKEHSPIEGMMLT